MKIRACVDEADAPLRAVRRRWWVSGRTVGSCRRKLPVLVFQKWWMLDGPEEVDTEYPSHLDENIELVVETQMSQ